MGTDDELTVELVSCPECRSVASVEWSTRIDGILHLKVRCIHRHWFFLPAARVFPFGSRRDSHQTSSLSTPPEN